MPSLLPILPPVLGATGLQLALEQPFFPGKVILWVLFMLSLMSWAVIASKLVSLRKFRQGDRKFTDHLRRSKRPLEIHEKGWSDPMSLRQEVYSAGAGEAAFQLLGSIRQQKSTALVAEKLSDSQMAGLREALHRGVAAADARLSIGMSTLQATAVGAPLLGLLGMVWIMMGSIGEAVPAAETSRGLSSALAVMAIGLLAAAPAVFGQIFLRGAIRNYLRELGDFRLELHRLFERSLSAVWNSEAIDKPADVIAPNEYFNTEATDSKKAKPSPTKVFKSVRQDEPMINPIAMKARQANHG